MGCERNTVQNMQVLIVRPDDNAILVKGSIPGGKQGVVLIRQAIKK
jgi:large subunit ribosomal protein L3